MSSHVGIGSTKSLIDSLIATLISDILNGKKISDSGWISLYDSHEQELKQMKRTKTIIENDDGLIRLNTDNRKAISELKQKYPEIRGQLDFALQSASFLHKDKRKAEEALNKLQKIVEILANTPEVWPYIVFFGWWKMLEESGLPAPTDAILSEGFSPRAWCIDGSLNSCILAVHIANRNGQIPSLEDVKLNLQKLGMDSSRNEFITSSLPDQVQSDKIMKILKWNQIENLISTNAQKAIGLIWYWYFMCAEEGLIPSTPDAWRGKFSELWNIITEFTNVNEATIDEILESFITEEIEWASNIVFLPEVIS